MNQYRPLHAATSDRPWYQALLRGLPLQGVLFTDPRGSMPPKGAQRVAVPQDPAARRAFLQAWAVRNRKRMAAGLSLSVLVLPFAAQAAPDGFTALHAIEGVASVTRAADGSTVVQMSDGRSFRLDPSQVTVDAATGELAVADSVAAGISGAVQTAAAGGGAMAGGLLAGAAVIGAAAGGGGGGAPVTLGYAFDGYISGGTVFRDTNNNGSLDDGERFTTTAADGSFDLAQVSGTGQLVVQGGVDISTGKALKGVLTAPEGAEVVSPLTTLIQASIAEAIAREETPPDAATIAQQLAEALGLPAGTDLLNTDPIATGDLETFKAAAQVGNILAVAEATGENNGALVAQNLVKILQERTEGDTPALSDVNVLTTAFAEAGVDATGTLAGALSEANDAIVKAEDVDKVQDVQTVVQGVVAEAVAAGDPDEGYELPKLAEELVKVTPLKPVITTDFADLITEGPLEITGTGRAGTLVEVSLNGVTLSTEVNSDNSWSVEFSADQLPMIGSATLTARSVSSGLDPTELALEFDRVIPDAPTIAAVTGDDVIDHEEQASPITVTGSTVANASLVVTLNGVNQTVTANAQGEWSATFDLTEAAIGTYEITAVATSPAGHTSAPAARSITLEPPPLEAPTIAAVTGDDVIDFAEQGQPVIVEGTAPANADLIITLGEIEQEVTADADGKWSVSFDLSGADPGMLDVSAVTVSKSGQTSAPVSRSLSVVTPSEVVLSPLQANSDTLVSRDVLHHTMRDLAPMIDEGGESGWMATAYQGLQFTLEIFGSDLATDPDSGKLASGIITGFELRSNDKPYVTVSNISADVAELWPYLHDQPDSLLFRSMLMGTKGMISTIEDPTENAADMNGSDGRDRVTGGEKDDVISGSLGSDTLKGEGGSDQLHYSRFEDAILADLEAGTVMKSIDGSIDQISGFEHLRGSQGADTLFGSSGSDEFMGLAGNDTIDGRGGNDTVRYDRDANYAGELRGVIVDLGEGTAIDGFGDTDKLINIENVRTGDGDDTVTGDDGNNQLRTGEGDDMIFGSGGNDRLRGEGGSDTVSYSNMSEAVQITTEQNGNIRVDKGIGIDTLEGIEAIRGTKFADSLEDTAGVGVGFMGLEGADTIMGSGKTALRYDRDAEFGGTEGIVAMIEHSNEQNSGTVIDGFGDTDVVSGIRMIRATDFDDYLEGGHGMTYVGYAGDDTIIGTEAGTTLVDYGREESAGATRAVTVNLALGTATDAYGNTDTLQWINVVNGTSRADTIIGGAMDDTITGGAGADSLVGGEGINMLDYSREGGQGKVIVNLLEGTARDSFGDLDSISGFQDVKVGSTGSEIHTDAEDNDIRIAGGANDVFGSAGDDTIQAESGSLMISYQALGAGVVVNLTIGIADKGENGTDSLAGVTALRGSGFADELIGNQQGQSFVGFAGNDTITGAADPTGLNVVRYDRDFQMEGNGAITVDLEAGTATDGFGDTDSLTNIQAVRAGFGDDSIAGDANNNIFVGMRGNDTIDGRGGFDILDYLTEQETSHFRDAGYEVRGIRVDMASGRAIDTYGTEDSFSNIEGIIATDLADMVIGDSADNLVEGLGGNDTLFGGDGNDTLLGDDGADHLIGGAGDDFIDLGSGVAVDHVYLSLGDSKGPGGLVSDSGFDQIFDFLPGMAGGEEADVLVLTLPEDYAGPADPQLNIIYAEVVNFEAATLSGALSEAQTGAAGSFDLLYVTDGTHARLYGLGEGDDGGSGLFAMAQIDGISNMDALLATRILIGEEPTPAALI